MPNKATNKYTYVQYFILKSLSTEHQTNQRNPINMTSNSLRITDVKDENILHS